MKNEYKQLLEQIRHIVDPHCSKTGNLCNIAALIYEKVEGLNWVGYYFKQEQNLVLDAFQGKVACTLIPLGRGVCGKAFHEKDTIIVPDVHAFADHIACDSASNSEIVVPLFKNGQIYGVLDIDSYQFNRFQAEEKELFEQIAKIIQLIL